MDPDAALARLRELAEEEPSAETAREMQELWQGLDDWLTSNGFLPRAWWQKEEHETRPAPEWAEVQPDEEERLALIFKAAWHEADAAGQAGSRVLAGLRAVREASR